MEKFTTFTGIAAPLKRSNVDTDQIIPAAYLKRVTKTGFDDALFARWRQEPDFVLNQEAFKNASVLVTGPDFGTGSSREHAVWALRDYGFRAVLSSRFGDIFRGNSGKQGLLAAQVEEENIEKLWAAIEAHPGEQITINLLDRVATMTQLVVPFSIDDYTRWRLLEGLDDIALTLRNEQKITQFEARRQTWRPRTLPVK
ncbi:3-isopropylmalate dehydratase small subunit [Lysinibacter sp. HNR]|uniref:3-isopropylmalate dehydratase small subunit n=1 Tax=Lysinibacter sp. HNR TaxID=3031408 RepID=UPI002435F5CA|nr:3-isopropylmalate dehydratase small subunit [Lysinibacter sp. HNR]WGD38389.1 3-isopropylmalate dehydratase small subunit [Lysinibacter sp. HNR]